MKGFRGLFVAFVAVAVVLIASADVFAQRRGNGGGFRGPRRGNVNFNFNGPRRGVGFATGRRGGTVIINQFGQPVPVGGFAVPFNYGVPVAPFGVPHCGVNAAAFGWGW